MPTPAPPAPPFRQTAEETLRLLSLSVEQAADAVMITDAQINLPGPHILYVNPAFLRMTGYCPEEVLGRTPRILQGPETSRELLQVLRTCLIEGTPFFGQGINYRKGQQPYYAEWRITPLRSDRGEVTHYLATLRDITDRCLYEQEVGERLARTHAYSRRLQTQKEALEAANAQLRALATTDGLTGLRNHRDFHQQLDQEVRRAARENSPLSLIMLDVDYFKGYNDRFGHPAGDEVLKTVAALLGGQARTVDIVARYGGEEFALLMPATDAVGAGSAAERLRRAVEAHSWEARAVTISLGVATRTPGPAPAPRLLDEADRALYHSKAAGRNCVTHFRTLGP